MNLFTEKLISPTNLEQNSLNLLPKSNLILRGSNTSLLSIINSSGDSIRVCKDCKMLLNRRDQQIEDKQSKPIISQFYERMRQHMKEVERLTPLYYQMSDSLRYSYFKFTIK
jgi:rabenosyn-5